MPHLSTTADVYMVEDEEKVIGRVAAHLAERDVRKEASPPVPVTRGYAAGDLAVLLGEAGQ
jgi:integrase/recombinase XerD